MKNLKLKNLALASCGLWAMSTGFVQAGSAVSGGGSARVCFRDTAVADQVRANSGAISDEVLASDQVISIETYDLFEARMPRGLDGQVPVIAQLRDGETPSQYADRIVERMNATVPVVAASLQSSRQLFSDDRISLAPMSLQYRADEASLLNFQGDNCALVPMAQQEKRDQLWYLYIDSRLFNHPKTSALSRGVLILHEMAYAYARAYGATDSANTRRFVGLLINNASDRKLLTVANDICGLGFMPEGISCMRGLSNDLVNHLAPVALLWRAALNTISFPPPGLEAFLSPDPNFREAEGSPSLSELNAEAKRILDAYRIDYHGEFESHALNSYLGQVRARSEGERIRISNLRDSISRTIVAQTDAFRQRLTQEFQQSIAQSLERPIYNYLTQRQKETIYFAASLFAERIAETNNKMFTREEISARLAANPYEVYRLTDFSPNNDVDKARIVFQWLKEIARTRYIGMYPGLDLNSLNFPVL